MSRLNKRLQVIEGSENDGNYCGCFTEYQMAVIEKVYNGVPNKIEFESLPKDFCGKCQKPVDTQFIDNFYVNLAAILPMYEIQMPVAVEVPAGFISRSDVAARLEIKAGDVERYIRSGRLQTDASKRFISRDSFDELKTLIRQRNEPSERF